uniref:CCHC-type domain-containing protein n=1 Tax=Tanacetum cinerariifolium TaxID=118510 RepID=A0A699L6F6_TANCI|nr:hypothetical protein [Tanacetum cinerariifolium]
MVNTRTDADLSVAVQNALQTLLPQIRAEIREEFRTSSGPSDAAPVDAENWISHMEKIFDVIGCEDAFKTRLAMYKFKAAAGTEEEQAKNFQWGLRRSTLNHLMCMSYTDVAQVANAAHNYEILYERDDDDAERPDKRNFGNGRDQRYRGQQSNRSTNFGSQQSKGPSEGYSYPVCTTCGRRHPGECRRAAGTYFKCGQAGHLQKDCKKNNTASTSG